METPSATDPIMEFTSVPAYGSYLNLKGVVRHIDTESVRVATYIRVHGGWWTKPYWDSPATAVTRDGTFSVDVTTGGHDEQASDIAAFLIPADYDPPVVRGEPELPVELVNKALAPDVTARPSAADGPKSFVSSPSFNNLAGGDLDTSIRRSASSMSTTLRPTAPDRWSNGTWRRRGRARSPSSRMNAAAPPASTARCAPASKEIRSSRRRRPSSPTGGAGSPGRYKPERLADWGQFIRFLSRPGDRFRRDRQRQRLPRPASSPHLRTFYAALYQDPRDEGQRHSFLSIACDVAHIFAMLEMAGRAPSSSRSAVPIQPRESINDDKVRQAQLRRDGDPRQGAAPRAAAEASREFPRGLGVGAPSSGSRPDRRRRRRPFQNASVLSVSAIRCGSAGRHQTPPAVFDVRPDELESLALPMPVLAGRIRRGAAGTTAAHESRSNAHTWQASHRQRRYFKFHYPFMRRMMASFAPFEAQACAGPSNQSQGIRRALARSVESRSSSLRPSGSFDSSGDGTTR